MTFYEKPWLTGIRNSLQFFILCMFRFVSGKKKTIFQEELT